MIAVTLLLVCAGSAFGQQIASQGFTCLEDGFYPDEIQCDKYYDCYRGNMEAKLCPDGLAFDYTLGPRVEQCNYPFIVPCPENSILQPAKPTGLECPRMNGFFEHEDPSNCAEYYECTHGIPVKRNCHTGLIFDEFTGSCQWESENLRSGCGANRPRLVLDDGFFCPNATQIHTNGQELDHARYLKEDDCRYFYVCAENIYPQLVGCPEGTVFNDVTLLCDDPLNVPGCENYYGFVEEKPKKQVQQQQQQQQGGRPHPAN